MKILFVWDVAGVSCVFAKYLRRRGHEVKVMSRALQDEFHFLDFYGETRLDVEGGEFDMMAYKEAENHDIIHCNAVPKVANFIKQQYPNKKVLIEYHGSELRMLHQDNPHVDKTLVSTPDLVKFMPGAEWLPNPVDVEHFKPSDHEEGAVFFKEYYHEEPTEIPFPFDIVNREQPRLHSSIPFLLQQWDTFIDYRFYKGFGLLDFPSKTSLEALATGMKVYNHKRMLIRGLPSMHRGDIATLKLEKIYNSL